MTTLTKRALQVLERVDKLSAYGRDWVPVAAVGSPATVQALVRAGQLQYTILLPPHVKRRTPAVRSVRRFKAVAPDGIVTTCVTPVGAAQWLYTTVGQQPVGVAYHELVHDIAVTGRAAINGATITEVDHRGREIKRAP